MSDKTKPRVLFVDDAVNILNGLRRMLRSVRNEWDLDFASGGAEALEKMETAAFDVVVSDMNMPKMTGAELLAEVMKRHPNTIRFILSGHANYEQVIRTIGPTHQYMSKPCDADTLKTAIANALNLRTVLSNEKLRALVTSLDNLPSVPQVYIELNEKLANGGASSKDISDIVSQDLGMTAKILQLVNSSFFGLKREIADVGEAVSYLGLETVQSLMMSAGIFKQVELDQFGAFPVESLWNHSFRTASLARNIMKSNRTAAEKSGEGFLAGMLHDLGKLVLAMSILDRYLEIIEVSEQEQVPVEVVEKRELGATHAEVGAYLLGLWGLPNTIVEAVTMHHNPKLFSASGLTAGTAVHVANALDAKTYQPFIKGAPSLLDDLYLDELGLKKRLEEWENLAAPEITQGV